VHDAYKKVPRAALVAVQRVHACSFARACAATSQAKAKGVSLMQDVQAVQTDRDELQKKYEAKSRRVLGPALRKCTHERELTFARRCVILQREAAAGRAAEQAGGRKPGARVLRLHCAKLACLEFGSRIDRVCLSVAPFFPCVPPQSLKANWRGPPGALQQHAAQHEAAVAAAQQAHGAGAMAHGGFAGGGMQHTGFGGGGGAPPMLRTASVHHFSAQNAPGGEALVTHTRSIHAASLRFDHYSGGPPGGGGMPTPGRGYAPAPHPGDGGSIMNGMSFHAPSPSGA
jgi:hypothetical protein